MNIELQSWISVTNNKNIFSTLQKTIIITTTRFPYSKKHTIQGETFLMLFPLSHQQKTRQSFDHNRDWQQMMRNDRKSGNFATILRFLPPE